MSQAEEKEGKEKKRFVERGGSLTPFDIFWVHLELSKESAF